MQTRAAIDTFYTGFQCDFDSIEYLVQKINNYLSFEGVHLLDEDEAKVKNPYYTNGISNALIGYSIYWNPKYGVKNKPITLELAGHFFRFDVISRMFINRLLELKDIMFVQRLDVATDFIYKENEKVNYRGKKIFNKYMPWARFRVENSHNGIIPKHEGHFTLVGDKVVVDGFNIGRKESKLRVYDKNLDLLDKDNDTYLAIYGIPDSDIVYRVEYMQRGDTFKGAWSRVVDNINNYDDLYYFGLNQMLSKYEFFNCSFENRKSFSVSSYIKREKPLIENQLEYCKNRIRKEYSKYLSIRQEYLEKMKNVNNLDIEPSVVVPVNDVDFYKLMESEDVKS